jgi:UDP-N-acetyl-D-glucosamine dehydrogenase
VNEQMPYYVVTRLMSALNTHRKSLAGAKVLMLGVAYKADIDDMRESPAIKIAELLKTNGADISYHDPYVPAFRADGVDLLSSELTEALLADSDIVLVVTDHSNVPYDLVVQHAPLILDTRNALKTFDSNKVVRL